MNKLENDSVGILNQLGAEPKARARRLDVLKKLTTKDKEFVESVLKEWKQLFPVGVQR